MSFFYRIAKRLGRRVGPDSTAGRALRPVAERLIRWSAGSAGLAWEVNGVACWIDPACRARFAPDYDAPVAAYLRGRVRPGGVCLDVGANVGVWVIQFADMVGPAGKVVAFEPNPGARVLLDRHVALNRLADRVTVVPAAVGAVAGEAVLYAAAADGMSRLGEPNPLLRDSARPITVPVVALDDYCERHGVEPDWVLLDVEGFEADALRGAARLIARRQPALGIVAELHPDGWPSAGTTRADFEALLAGLGRQAVPLTGQTDPLGEYGIIALEPIGGPA